MKSLFNKQHLFIIFIINCCLPIYMINNVKNFFFFFSFFFFLLFISASLPFFLSTFSHFFLLSFFSLSFLCIKSLILSVLFLLMTDQITNIQGILLYQSVFGVAVNTPILIHSHILMIHQHYHLAKYWLIICTVQWLPEMM